VLQGSVFVVAEMRSDFYMDLFCVSQGHVGYRDPFCVSQGCVGYRDPFCVSQGRVGYRDPFCVSWRSVLIVATCLAVGALLGARIPQHTVSLALCTKFGFLVLVKLVSYSLQQDTKFTQQRGRLTLTYYRTIS
jgi:hypothetical protein